MHKYPKTPRLEHLPSDSIVQWRHRLAVVEEKVDGANAALYFEAGKLVIQSRGHVLRGGPSEALFERLHPWAHVRSNDLRDALGTRYVAFGEWVFAKNRVFYDALPDYFIEFDVWDKETGTFLSTARRKALLEGSPLKSVAVLWEGQFSKAPAFGSFIQASKYKTTRWKEAYDKAMATGLSKHYNDSETDDSIQMEGVYVKVEDEQGVVGRFKILRPEFEKVRTDDRKWGRRPIFPNQLAR